MTKVGLVCRERESSPISSAAFPSNARNLESLYWLRWDGSTLQFADGLRAIPVPDMSPLPFNQYVCQMVVTDDGIHRLAILYEVNGEAIVGEALLHALSSLAQYDVPILPYEIVSMQDAHSLSFIQRPNRLIAQADAEGQWASFSLIRGQSSQPL